MVGMRIQLCDSDQVGRESQDSRDGPRTQEDCELNHPVIRAYRQCCSICRLKHLELLEAAHIIPDKDPRGLPTVTNGLALCALHHKAFDLHILGIRPDYKIEQRQDILDEVDGPMLRHGLQGFQDKVLLLPRRPVERPSQDT